MHPLPWTELDEHTTSACLPSLPFLCSPHPTDLLSFGSTLDHPTSYRDIFLWLLLLSVLTLHSFIQYLLSILHFAGPCDQRWRLGHSTQWARSLVNLNKGQRHNTQMRELCSFRCEDKTRCVRGIWGQQTIEWVIRKCFSGRSHISWDTHAKNPGVGVCGYLHFTLVDSEESLSAGSFMFN